MSKRTHSQAKRRQIRRALNVCLDAVKGMGHSRARNHGYKTGLNTAELKTRTEVED